MLSWLLLELKGRATFKVGEKFVQPFLPGYSFIPEICRNFVNGFGDIWRLGIGV